MNFVRDSVEFPTPQFKLCAVRKVNILTKKNTAVERKSALDNNDGRLYEIGSLLKKAIFGQVVHAIGLQQLDDGNFVRTNQEFAIKVYSKRALVAANGRTQENPLREISALQYIGDNHPNIMGQIECCADEDNIYSIMRFIKGGELFDYIDEIGKMEEPQAREFFKQLMNGLLRLQELGIGHRDMSLENILYDGANLYVIIDFGMCMLLQRNPASPSGYWNVAKQSICGKRNYIAPEVLRGDESFNPLLCDVWAAGVILFMVLTGLPPVDTATLADERYHMICENQLSALLAGWQRSLSPSVEDLLQRILRPNPLDRLTLQQIMQHPWMTGA